MPGTLKRRTKATSRVGILMEITFICLLHQTTSCYLSQRFSIRAVNILARTEAISFALAILDLGTLRSSRL